MPKYTKREPEFTAIHFNGGNIQDFLDELGPDFSTVYPVDTEMSDFAIRYRVTGLNYQVRRGYWLVYDAEFGDVQVIPDAEFQRYYVPRKRAEVAVEEKPAARRGRPPKEKK